MGKENINEEYDLMDENEKFAMRYGAEGRHLSDVIRDSPGEITSPDKMLDAWDRGMNMRKDGTSKVFLYDIEKEKMSNLTASIAPKADSNGITAEPIRDMFGNDLSESSSFGNSEESGIPPKELKSDFGEDENYTPKGENYLLQPEENYDKMYVTNYSNEANSGRIDAPGRESLFLFGDNVLLRPWKRLLGGTLGISKDYGNNVAQAIDEDRLKPKEEEGVIPEFHYTMGADDIYRALEDWHHEQMNNK